MLKTRYSAFQNIFVADEYKEKCYRIVQLTYNSSKLELSRKVPFFSWVIRFFDKYLQNEHLNLITQHSLEKQNCPFKWRSMFNEVNLTDEIITFLWLWKVNSKTKKCENVPSDGRLCAFVIQSTHSFLTSFKDANAEVCRASITLSVRPLCKNKKC